MREVADGDDLGRESPVQVLNVDCPDGPLVSRQELVDFGGAVASRAVSKLGDMLELGYLELSSAIRGAGGL